MPARKKVGVAIDGPFIRLGDGQSLKAVEVVIQPPQFGRILFAEPTTCGVLVEGRNISITHCYIHGSGGQSSSVCVMAR